MPATKNDAFLSTRSRALAIMHLTRRDDLEITDPSNGKRAFDWDFLVSIQEDAHKASVRQFAVVIRGTMTKVTDEQVNRQLKAGFLRFRRFGEFPYPVCLFHFTMEDNEGRFTWIAEPIVTKEGQPKLRTHSTPNCQELDREALDRIVERVNEWYDAFLATVRV